MHIRILLKLTMLSMLAHSRTMLPFDAYEHLNDFDGSSRWYNGATVAAAITFNENP